MQHFSYWSFHLISSRQTPKEILFAEVRLCTLTITLDLCLCVYVRRQIFSEWFQRIRDRCVTHSHPSSRLGNCCLERPAQCLLENSWRCCDKDLLQCRDSRKVFGLLSLHLCLHQNTLTHFITSLGEPTQKHYYLLQVFSELCQFPMPNSGWGQ